MFSEIISRVPLRDYGQPGLEVRADHTSTGTAYFVRATQEVAFPTHAHAEQWTIVVSGECELTLQGRTTTYRQGDSYRIPSGERRSIVLRAGYSEVDYVDAPND